MMSMVFKNSSTTIFISLLFLLSFIFSFVRPTTTPAVLLQPSHDLQSFQIKNAVFLNTNDKPNNLHRKKKLLTKKKKRLIMNNNLDDERRFSAMLPKGYVPPSGSSPCHNVYPNSVTFFCDLSAQP